MNADHHNFESLAAMLARLEVPSIQKVNQNQGSYATDSTFHGTRDFAEAMKFARDGWPQGLARVTSARALIATPAAVSSFVPAPMISEEGDEVLIDRFLDGESDCWLDFPMAPAPARGRVVPVVVHVGGNGMVSEASFANRGAAAIAIIDALENAGFRSEIWIASRSKTSGLDFRFSCCLKRAEDALDIDRLAFFLCSPAVQRRFLFRLRDSGPNGQTWQGASYGSTQALSEAERPHGGDGVYLPSPARHYSQAEAQAAVEAELARFLAPA